MSTVIALLFSLKFDKNREFSAIGLGKIPFEFCRNFCVLWLCCFVGVVITLSVVAVVVIE